MGKIFACIDGSAYADSVCALSVWAAKQTKRGVALLHVVTPNSDIAAKSDLSGQIGLGAKSGLLKELAEMDEARAKLEQKKGQLILRHGTEELAEHGLTPVEVLHRRGSLVDTLEEFESEADMIVIGKRGEYAQNASRHLGSNMERVARTIRVPLMVTPKQAKPVRRFLIAYDASASANKAVEYVANSALFTGLECHILKVGDDTPEAQSLLKKAGDKLSQAGYTVHMHIQQGKSVEDATMDYINDHNTQLLLIGAYGHSRIRSLILGSTTTTLIRKSNIPLLLFR